MTMAIKITTTLQRGEEVRVKLLVYGAMGLGKTRLIRTAPDPLLLSTEDGTLSLRDDDIPTIKILSIQDIWDAYDYLMTKEAMDTYQTVCLDGITDMAEIQLSKLKDELTDGRQIYGKLADEMKDMIRGFRRITHFHIYFTAKEIRRTDDYTGLTKYAPNMPGQQLLNDIGYPFDEVAPLRIAETEGGDLYTYLQFQPDVSYEAKDRSGSLDAIEKPDLSRIFSRIQNLRRPNKSRAVQKAAEKPHSLAERTEKQAEKPFKKTAEKPTEEKTNEDSDPKKQGEEPTKGKEKAKAKAK